MIVIPMAGLSQRFARAGYDRPKFMLRAHGRSVFAHAVLSFAACFRTEAFLFVVRDDPATIGFVRAEAAALGIRDCRIVTLAAPTRGQAETVAIGLDRAAIATDTPLTIFNIDTFRPGYTFPADIPPAVDGYLEVFRGAGDNWSYVRPHPDRPGQALETAEKRPISDLCCTGLYYFGTTGLFQDAFRRTVAAFPGSDLQEMYVAPMYNLLIADGRDVRYHVIPSDAVIFCGVPAEYEAFLSAPLPPAMQAAAGAAPS